MFAPGYYMSGAYRASLLAGTPAGPNRDPVRLPVTVPVYRSFTDGLPVPLRTLPAKPIVLPSGCVGCSRAPAVVAAGASQGVTVAPPAGAPAFSMGATSAPSSGKLGMPTSSSAAPAGGIVPPRDPREVLAWIGEHGGKILLALLALVVVTLALRRR